MRGGMDGTKRGIRGVLMQVAGGACRAGQLGTEHVATVRRVLDYRQCSIRVPGNACIYSEGKHIYIYRYIHVSKEGRKYECGLAKGDGRRNAFILAIPN